MSKIVIWILFLSIGFTNIANAMDMANHIPVPCIGCHYETLNIPSGQGNDCDGGCHSISKEELVSQHDPKICKTCHMGNTVVGGSEKEIFHNGHNAVNCTQCHTEDNFTVIKIKGNGFECVSCHGRIHNIHIKNLEKICPLCHGSYANDKIYKAPASTEKSNMSLQIANLERFTLFSFLRGIFNSILGTM